MKITVNQSLEFTENEIIINCSTMDDRLHHLFKIIKQYSFCLNGYKDGEIYQVPLESIFYVDAVDGKTFLYSKQSVLESKENLISLEEKLFNTPFVRIGKNCILNCSHLRSVKPIVNHRLQATLNNGEKLIISRNYIENLKEKLKK